MNRSIRSSEIKRECRTKNKKREKRRMNARGRGVCDGDRKEGRGGGGSRNVVHIYDGIKGDKDVRERKRVAET